MPTHRQRLTSLFQRALASSSSPSSFSSRTMPALLQSSRAATAACGPPLVPALVRSPGAVRPPTHLPPRRWLTTCLAVPAVAAAAAPAPTTSPPGELTKEMVWAGRTADAGRLTLTDVGRTLTVAGWVHRARALGGKTFVDVRDASGLIQVVSADAEEGGDGAGATAAAALERLRAEFVVLVRGTLRRRKDPNPKLATGEVELVAEEVSWWWEQGEAGRDALPLY